VLVLVLSWRLFISRLFFAGNPLLLLKRHLLLGRDPSWQRGFTDVDPPLIPAQKNPLLISYSFYEGI